MRHKKEYSTFLIFLPFYSQKIAVHSSKEKSTNHQNYQNREILEIVPTRTDIDGKRPREKQNQVKPKPSESSVLSTSQVYNMEKRFLFFT